MKPMMNDHEDKKETPNQKVVTNHNSQQERTRKESPQMFNVDANDEGPKIKVKHGMGGGAVSRLDEP